MKTLVLWICVTACAVGWSAGCEVKPSPQEQSPADGGGSDAMPEGPKIVSKAAKLDISDLKKIVPNPDFPTQVMAQTSNNNLDVIDFEGRMFLSFRTGPTHFASDKVVLYIVSTTDQKSWTFEAKIFMKTDLREPRFFAWKKELYLYFARLGADQSSFDPGSTWRVVRKKEGDWGAPEMVFDDGFIPWRIKWFNGTPMMTGYTGGEHIYKFDGEKLKVYLRTTTDGRTWKPLDAKRPVVLEGGASETDIAFGGDGALYAIARNEAGDKDGFGSKVCRAPKDDLSNWTCKPDPKKYDSPLLFSYKGEVYLVGRRNISDTGNYDLQSKEDLTHAQRGAKYQLDYWKRPKRCAVWLLRREALTIEFIKDLPSKGDTCFPSVLQRGEGKFLLFNYSSDVDGEDRSWLNGQTNPTFIYSMLLTFTPQ